MDMQEETAKMKKLFGVVMAFIVSIFLTWTEAKYFLFAKTATATVQQKMLLTGRGRFGTEKRTIQATYRWDVNGTPREERDSVAEDFPLPADGQDVKIQYLADRSRLAGHYSIVGPLIFFGALIALLYFSIDIWKKSRNDRPVR